MKLNTYDEVITLYYNGKNTYGSISHAKIDNAIFWKSLLEKKGFYVEEKVEKIFVTSYHYNNRGELLQKVLRDIA